MLKRIRKQASLRLNMILIKSLLENSKVGTALVARRLRIQLPVQRTYIQSLVQEGPTRCRATKPMHDNYFARALESMLRNKRSYCSEKPTHHS